MLNDLFNTCEQLREPGGFTSTKKTIPYLNEPLQVKNNKEKGPYTY